jgi:predicted Zn-dependent protease
MSHNKIEKKLATSFGSKSWKKVCCTTVQVQVIAKSRWVISGKVSIKKAIKSL